MSIAILVKGYPRLSETFIAQELLGLEARGFQLHIVSLCQPKEPCRQTIHTRIRAPVLYLPEYLKEDPSRVRAGRLHAQKAPGFAIAFAAFQKDRQRDAQMRRWRWWAQACILAAELPKEVCWIHTHYLHAPASVGRYAALLLGLGWSFSAHAKDIWTSPTEELRSKLECAAWGVTCTQANLSYLRNLTSIPERISLVYHGLDVSSFPPLPPFLSKPSSGKPLRILSVGRLVEKKAYDDVIRALALLKERKDWEFHQIGDGKLHARLIRQAEKAGIAERLIWHGARPRETILDALAETTVFVLPCRIARSGDRDGLPNVLMEAQAMGVPVVSTMVSAIPELILPEQTGLLVPPRNPKALAQALVRLLEDATLRQRLGVAGAERVRKEFCPEIGLAFLERAFRQALEGVRDKAL